MVGLSAARRGHHINLCEKRKW